MSRAPILALALGAVLALGACADDSGHLPTAESPALLTTGGPTCSPTDLRKATEAVFGKNSPEARIAGQFKPQTANTAGVTPLAYQLFAAIAAKRAASGWTSANVAPSANLSVHITACADLAFTEPSLPGTGTQLLDAFTAALSDGGTYAVRGPGYEAPAVVSHDARAGILPPATFAGWLGAPALVLGHPLPASFTSETPGGAQYEWFLLRPRGAVPLSGLATVSLCTDDAPVDDTMLRIQHLASAQGGNIIPYVAPAAAAPLACEPETAASRAGGGATRRLFTALEAAVLPRPLFAAAVGAYGPVSGLIGSFSPFEVVYPEQIVMRWVTPPVDGEVNVPIPVVVGITGAGGTPWEDVTVELSAFANNGQPLTLCGNRAETDAQGIARFPDFRLSKAGGVYIVATTLEPSADPDVTAYSKQTLESNRFNVRPATGSTVPCG